MIMTNFMKAPPEKQRVIINAGFLCFGQNGYQKASAADVAKAAGILYNNKTIKILCFDQRLENPALAIKIQ